MSAWDWLLCRDSGDKGRGGAAGASAGAAGLLGSLLGYHGVARVSVLVGLLFLGSLVVRGFTYGGFVQLCHISPSHSCCQKFTAIEFSSIVQLAPR